MHFLKIVILLISISFLTLNTTKNLIVPETLQEICDLLDSDSTTLYGTVDTDWLTGGLTDAYNAADTQDTRYTSLYSKMSGGDIADCDDYFSQLTDILSIFDDTSVDISTEYTAASSNLASALDYYDSEDYENSLLYYNFYMSNLETILVYNDACLSYNSAISDILVEIDAILATYE